MKDSVSIRSTGLEMDTRSTSKNQEEADSMRVRDTERN